MTINQESAAKARKMVQDGKWIIDPYLGRVRSRRYGGRIVSHPGRGGYRFVRVRINGEQRDVYEHRVVYESVHGPVPEGLQVHHINHRRDDNRPGNLRAVTASENRLESVKAGRIKTKIVGEQVDELRLRWAAGESVKKLAADYGLSAKHVQEIGRGKSWAWRPWPRERLSTL